MFHMPAPNNILVINGRVIKRPQGCSSDSWKKLLKEDIANTGGKEYIPCDIYGRSEVDRLKDKSDEDRFNSGANDVDELEFKQMYDTERKLLLEGKAEVVQLLLAKTETSEQIKKMKADVSGAVNTPKLKTGLENFVKTTIFAKEEKKMNLSVTTYVLSSEDRINVGQYIIGTEKQNQKNAATKELESTLKGQVELISAKEIVLTEIENEIRVNIVTAHKKFMSQVLEGKGGKDRTTYAGRRDVAGAIVKRPLEDAEEPDNEERKKPRASVELTRCNSYETMKGTVSFDDIVTKVARQIQDKGDTMETRFEWLVGAMDTDGNGSISYSEFMKKRSILSLTMEEMSKLWEPLPKDNKEVSVTDFAVALESVF
jgi:hypothetical protein